MPPRLMRASGLSGLSSRDLRVEARAHQGCRDFVDAAQVDEGIGVVRIEL